MLSVGIFEPLSDPPRMPSLGLYSLLPSTQSVRSRLDTQHGRTCTRMDSVLIITILGVHSVDTYCTLARISLLHVDYTNDAQRVHHDHAYAFITFHSCPQRYWMFMRHATNSSVVIATMCRSCAIRCRLQDLTNCLAATRCY